MTHAKTCPTRNQGSKYNHSNPWGPPNVVWTVQGVLKHMHANGGELDATDNAGGLHGIRKTVMQQLLADGLVESRGFAKFKITPKGEEVAVWGARGYGGVK